MNTPAHPPSNWPLKAVHKALAATMLQKTIPKTRTAALLLALAAATVSILTATTPSHAQGVWTGQHGDAARTGRAQGAGAVERPSVLWGINTGGRVSDRASLVQDINGDGQPDALVIVGGTVVARRMDQTLLWDTPALGLTELVAADDFNGDGRTEVLALGPIAILFDGRTGTELWRYEDPEGGVLVGITALHGDLDADGDGGMELLLAILRPTTRLVYHDFSQGLTQTERWALDNEALPRNVLRPVIGHFDGPQVTPSVAIVNQLNCQIVLTALDTGQITRITQGLTQGRFCYGLAQAADVDGDQTDELFFTGAVGQSNGSVSATVYDPAQDTIVWQHEYATNVADVLTFSPTGAVMDLDGDGRQELITSVFNNTAELDSDDGVDNPDSWSTIIYDAATGDLLGFLPDRVVLGGADVNGDGNPEVIVRATLPQSVRVSEFDTIEIVSLDNQRQPQVGWTLPNTNVLTRTPRSLSVSSRDNGVVPAVATLDDGRPRLLTVERQDETRWTLKAIGFGPPGEEPQTLASAQVQPGVARTFLGQTGPQTIIKDNQGQISLLDADLNTTQNVAFTGHVSSLLAIPLTSERLDVVYRDSAGVLVAVDPQTANRATPPQELWRASVGRRAGEFIAADLDDDGLYEVIHCGELDDGTPFIEALDGQGQRLWRRSLSGGLGLPFSLLQGDFNGDDHGDIAALLFTIDGQAQTVSLDGRNGRSLATHTADPQQVQRFPNRELLGPGDLDGDQIDDILLLHYTTMERLSGPTLEPLEAPIPYPPSTARPASSVLVPTGPNDPAPRVYLGLFTNQKALYDVRTAALVWSVPSEPSFNAVQTNYPGLTDVDEDGLWDIAQPGRFGDLTILSGADGQILRRLCMAGGEPRLLDTAASAENCSGTTSIASVTVADIDGDGNEDHLVGVSDGWLHALRASDAQPIWSLFLKASVSEPALIDIDNDGALEILTTTADSQLVAIDNPTVEPVTEVREVLLGPMDELVAPDTDIDTSSRLDALGVAWDSAEGADGYLVTLLSENLNEVTPPLTVTDPWLTFTDLSLVPGVTYLVQVVAFNTQTGAAEPTVSDGVLIIDDGPSIVGFEAMPSPFDPATQPPLVLTATVTAPAGLDRLELTIWSLDNPDLGQLLQTTVPGESEIRLDFESTWDGRDGFGFVPAGNYRAQLVAFDQDGAGIADIANINIAYMAIEPEPESPPEPTPDPGDNSVGVTGARSGSGCGCQQLQGPSPASNLWWSALVLIGAAVLSVRRRRIGPSSHNNSQTH